MRQNASIGGKGLKKNTCQRKRDRQTMEKQSLYLSSYQSKEHLCKNEGRYRFLHDSFLVIVTLTKEYCRNIRSAHHLNMVNTCGK